jgi:hypothetical protein
MPTPTPTKRELLGRIDELEAENENLQGQLDEISDIITPSEEDEEDEQE